MCCKGFLIVLFGVNYFAFGQTNNNDDCRSPSDVNWPYSYNGTKHTTVTGNTCENWNQGHPNYGPQNYCRADRNDLASAKGPWCYTAVGWEYCYIPVCDIDCQVSTTDKDYRGSLNVTTSGLTCRKWSLLTISPYNNESTYHHNETLNYCRTPATDAEPTPWCYTTSKDKKWETCDVPLCSAINGTKCPDLLQEPNMISPKRLTGYFYRDRVIFQCDRGYSLSSAESLTCQATNDQYHGSWSRYQPKCLPKSCPDLNQDSNMILPTQFTGYIYRDQVVFQCAEGYLLSSLGNLICQASSLQNIGQWSRKQPSCLRKGCPDFRQDSIMILPTKLTGYVYQNQVAFQCAEGYTLSSAGNLTCVASSQLTIVRWSSPQPRCLPKNCGRLSVDERVLKSENSSKYNDNVTLSCKEGYNGASLILNCYANGSWPTQRPNCTGIPCPPLPKIDKSILQDDTREYRYPETLNVTCETGYVVEGSDLLECNSSGFWSSIPQCSCKETTLPYTDSEERNGVYMSYGLFGAVLAAIVIISTGIHIGTCFYYRKRLRKHVTVYEDIKFNTAERQTSSNEETYTELT